MKRSIKRSRKSSKKLDGTRSTRSTSSRSSRLSIRSRSSRSSRRSRKVRNKTRRRVSKIHTKLTDVQKLQRRSTMNKNALEKCVKYGLDSEDCWRGLMPLSHEDRANIRDIVRRISEHTGRTENQDKIANIVENQPELKNIVNSFAIKHLNISSDSKLAKDFVESDSSTELITKLPDEFQNKFIAEKKPEKRKELVEQTMSVLTPAVKDLAQRLLDICTDVDILDLASKIIKDNNLLDDNIGAISDTNFERLYNDLKNQLSEKCILDYTFNDFKQYFKAKGLISMSDDKIILADIIIKSVDIQNAIKQLPGLKNITLYPRIIAILVSELDEYQVNKIVPKQTTIDGITIPETAIIDFLNENKKVVTKTILENINLNICTCEQVVAGLLKEFPKKVVTPSILLPFLYKLSKIEDKLACKVDKETGYLERFNACVLSKGFTIVSVEDMKNANGLIGNVTISPEEIESFEEMDKLSLDAREALLNFNGDLTDKQKCDLVLAKFKGDESAIQKAIKKLDPNYSYSKDWRVWVAGAGIVAILALGTYLYLTGGLPLSGLSFLSGYLETAGKYLKDNSSYVVEFVSSNWSNIPTVDDMAKYLPDIKKLTEKLTVDSNSFLGGVINKVGKKASGFASFIAQSVPFAAPAIGTLMSMTGGSKKTVDPEKAEAIADVVSETIFTQTPEITTVLSNVDSDMLTKAGNWAWNNKKYIGGAVLGGAVVAGVGALGYYAIKKREEADNERTRADNEKNRADNEKNRADALEIEKNNLSVEITKLQVEKDIQKKIFEYAKELLDLVKSIEIYTTENKKIINDKREKIRIYIYENNKNIENDSNLKNSIEKIFKIIDSSFPKGYFQEIL